MGWLATVPIDFRPARPVSGAKPVLGDHVLARAADPELTRSHQCAWVQTRHKTVVAMAKFLSRFCSRVFGAQTHNEHCRNPLGQGAIYRETFKPALEDRILPVYQIPIEIYE